MLVATVDAASERGYRPLPTAPGTSMRAVALLAGLLSGPSLAAEPGAPVAEAIVVQVPPQGLQRLGGVVRDVLPKTLTIEASAGELACADDDETPLLWSIDALDVRLSTDFVDISTRDGQLFLKLYLTMDSTASTVTVAGDCTVLTDLEEECALQLPTTAMEAAVSLSLAQLADGRIDATVDEITLDISPINNPLADCLLASAVGTLLGQDPEALSKLIEDLVAPELEGLGPTLEEALEDALGAASLETEVDLLGTPLTVAIEPTLLALDERGLVLGLGAEAYAPAYSDCVDWSAGSDLFEVGWPDLDETAGSTSLPHDAALMVSADFIDQLLFTAWAAGLLCIDAGQLLEEQAGLGITSGFLGSLLGDDFQTYFGEEVPVSLIIDPLTPPRVDFSDDKPAFTLDPGDLRLELWSELDQREVMVFQAEVLVYPGVDVSLVDGALTVALDLESEDIRLYEAMSDYLSPGWSGGVAGLLDTAISSQLPEGPLLSMVLPLPFGLGVDALVWWPSDDLSWHGGYLLLDTSSVAPIELAGCSLDGLGCDGGGVSGPELDLNALLGCDAGGGLGCDSGGGGCDSAGGCEGAACTTTRQQRLVGVARWRLVLLGLLALGAVTRRRR